MRNVILRWVCLACLGFGLPVLSAEATETVSATYVEAAPEIDGRLDEALWGDAHWHRGFTRLGSGEQIPYDSSFAVAYDDRYLYVAVRCVEPNLDQLRIAATERGDERLYEDDGIELFIAPGGQRIDYYQFQVNAAGVVADSAGYQAGLVRDLDWTSAVRVATLLGDDEWTAEIAIPFADLELSEEGDWGINVTRVRHAGEPRQLSTFVPLAGSFHQPGLFASLALPDAPLDELRWEMVSIDSFSTTREVGETVVRTQVGLRNRTGSAATVRLSSRLRRGDTLVEGEPVEARIEPGALTRLAVELPYVGDGSQHLEFVLSTEGKPSDIVMRRMFGIDLEFRMLDLELTQPAYQGAIFATQEVANITGNVRVALGEADRAGARLEAVLFSGDGVSRSLAETQIDLEDSKVTFALPAADLVEGAYTLRIRLVDAADEVLGEVSRVLRKLAPAPSGIEWRIDADGILLRNGEPFLPVGWFSLNAGALKTEAQDSNVAWLYLGPWQSEQEVLDRLDAIHAAGAYAIMYPTVGGRRPESITNAAISDEDAELIRERVRAVKDHPGLMAWYLADEPEYHRVLPSAVEQMRQIISEVDPFHPTIIVNNSLNGVRRFSRGADVLAPDPYPFFRVGGLSSAMGKVGSLITAASAETGPGQTVWVVPQAHDTTQFSGVGERAPSFFESRNMVWQAVAAGARGVVWWSWSRVYPNTLESVKGNAYLARELKAMKAFVLAPDQEDVALESGYAENLYFALRESAGEHALFATNVATTAQEAVFLLPELAGQYLVVLGEGRLEQVGSDGRLSVNFPPYGTYVFVTDSSYAAIERWEAVEAEIAELIAARWQPGNLAYTASGVAISASSRSRGHPTNLLDGVRDGFDWRAARFRDGDWVELVWPTVQTVGRVKIFTDSVADLKIELAPTSEGEADWKYVGSVSGASANPIELSFPPTPASRLRISVSRLRPQMTTTQMREIEVYAE